MESSVTTSGFPEYDDGDVQIVITPTKIYKLHSVVLRRHSPYFARLLREEDAAKLTKKAASENAIRYRAELVRSSIDEAPQFKLKVCDDDLLRVLMVTFYSLLTQKVTLRPARSSSPISLIRAEMSISK